MSRTSEPADAGRLLVSPFVVVVDSREKAPYGFASIHADAAQRQGGSPQVVLVRSVVRGLAAGDYTLEGHEPDTPLSVAVERKSACDLFGTLGQARARFVSELQRLAACEFAAVVVEAEWSELLGSPPAHSRLNPKTVHRSVIAWQQRYPRVHWWFLPGRDAAEVTTYRILERFWKEQQSRVQAH